MDGDGRELGIIKFYNPRKGYGFITRSDGSDVFFHLSHFRTSASPAPGCAVRFQVGQNREGLTAEDISLAALDEVDRYDARIELLDDDGGVALTDDGFRVKFRRADFVPHLRSESLRVGDEIELNFLIEDERGFRAAVARPDNWTPEPVAQRTERREGDDEEENRRLLGILYKTDLDEEASHAAGLLAERNMRATLSALVSRVFDRRLSPDTRRELVDRIRQVYFDDEVQIYLSQMADALVRAVDEEDQETSTGAVACLKLLLAEGFPVRWTQYLLPFGLSLLRNLAAVPACHNLLSSEDSDAEAEPWLQRVVRHVEQRRSGYGYVMTTAIATMDDLWSRELLHAPLRRCLARLLASLDAESLANQLHHLRDRLSPGFTRLLVPTLSGHPDLANALAAPGNAETFTSWVESLLDGEEPVPAEVLVSLLPLLQEIRGKAIDAEVVQRLMEPVTTGLSPDDVLRMLRDEDLPERSGWACLWHLQNQGQLEALLADADARTEVTHWLSRAAERTAPSAAPDEQQMNTALRLVESLRTRDELRVELAGIGANLFAGVHHRIEQASAAELCQMLDQFEPGELPGLSAALTRRLNDTSLDEAARRRLVAWFVELGAPWSEFAAAFVTWRRAPEDRPAVNDLITALVAAEGTGDPEAAACAAVAREALRAVDISWHEGFVVSVQAGPDGQQRAKLQGFGILLPQRIFAEKADFAPNRYVRLLLRRGMAMGVETAGAPETGYVCGRLDGPLFIDDRDAIVGMLVDLHGAGCYFELASLRSGQDRALDDGDLLRFTRMASVGEQPYQWVAFNVHAEFGPDDLPLLLETMVTASDAGVALAAARQALALGGDPRPALWLAHWPQLSADREAALRGGLDETALSRLDALLAPASD
ncbi:MAG: cold shock domain-containing protein [Armatimonadetes bacterium]|nr:cold shock domain-containing protein [Armatimonadota bacterium]